MITNEIIWITGASTGIGKALAIQLAESGNRVIASARNQEALDCLAHSHKNIEVLRFDVTNEPTLGGVSRKLMALTDRIDRVILNAGNCEYLVPEEIDWSMMRRVMDVNYFGLIRSLQIAIPLLIKADRPHIVGIGSLATELPFSRAEAYGASKAAVHYFLESLRMDVTQLNIDVTIIKPGFVDTPLTQKNTFPMPFLTTTEVAAQRIIKAVNRRDFQYSFPKRLNVLLKVLNLFPRSWLKRSADRSVGDLTLFQKNISVVSSLAEVTEK